ncbi:hypothetical protein D3C84_748940 [compost metagenome]
MQALFSFSQYAKTFFAKSRFVDSFSDAALILEVSFVFSIKRIIMASCFLRSIVNMRRWLSVSLLVWIFTMSIFREYFVLSFPIALLVISIALNVWLRSGL